MSEENISVKKLVQENITNFLEDAKIGGHLGFALSYLTAITATGYHEKVNDIDSELTDTFRKKANSLGILNENGVMSPRIQKDLQDYILDKNNKFILDNRSGENGQAIENAFSYLNKLLDDYKRNAPIIKQKTYDSLSPSDAIHEQMVNFIVRQGFEHQFESLYYLATLAIKGEFKKDELEVFEEKYLINKYNKDASDMGLASNKGIVSNLIKKALRSFFSKENKSLHMVKDCLPQLEVFFKQIEEEFARVERGNNRRII